MALLFNLGNLHHVRGFYPIYAPEMLKLVSTRSLEPASKLPMNINFEAMGIHWGKVYRGEIIVKLDEIPVKVPFEIRMAARPFRPFSSKVVNNTAGSIFHVSFIILFAITFFMAFAHLFLDEGVWGLNNWLVVGIFGILAIFFVILTFPPKTAKP